MLPALAVVPAVDLMRRMRTAAREQIMVGIIAVPESASAYLIISDIGEEPWTLTEEERRAIRETVANVASKADYPQLAATPVWRTDYCARLGSDGFNQQQLADDIVIALIAQSFKRFDFCHCMCVSRPGNDCKQMGDRLTQALQA